LSVSQNIGKLEKQKKELEKVIAKLKLEKNREHIASQIKKRKWVANIEIETCQIHVISKPDSQIDRSEIDRMQIADYRFSKIDAIMYKGKPTLDFVFEGIND
jgi:hypothetical protein